MSAMQALTLTDGQLATARLWLEDLEFVETAHMGVFERREFFAERSDAAIERAIVRHFDGGLAGFARTMA